MNAPSPLVSVITAVKDGVDHLGEAIDSVLAQTHPPLEHIVVDDGSTDGSGDLARNYGPPVIVLDQENQGISAARNRAMRHARGDLITILDADDRFAPEALEIAVQALSSGELDAVFFHIREFVSDGVDANRFAERGVGQPWPARMPSTMVIRRSVAERVGPFDQSLVRASGLDWTSRLLHLPARTAILPEVLLERRLHRNNHGSNRPDAITDYVRMARQHLIRNRGQTS